MGEPPKRSNSAFSFNSGTLAKKKSKKKSHGPKTLALFSFFLCLFVFSRTVGARALSSLIAIAKYRELDGGPIPQTGRVQPRIWNPVVTTGKVHPEAPVVGRHPPFLSHVYKHNNSLGVMPLLSMPYMVRLRRLPSGVFHNCDPDITKPHPGAIWLRQHCAPLWRLVFHHRLSNALITAYQLLRCVSNQSVNVPIGTLFATMGVIVKPETPHSNVTSDGDYRKL
ncbi:hypothetical protein BGW80DRAFT_768900 [Lactifluus volemus]|nr:hypothetical protein BGW80DRAFT_768900 [Lactifluus volemus]